MPTSGAQPGQGVFRWCTTTSNIFPPMRPPAKPKHPSPPTKPASPLTQPPRLPDATPGTAPPPLPPSVEMAYRNKCIDLKRRMNEVEESNDAYRLRKVRLLRGIRKMRLQRAFLLEALAKRMKKTRRHGGILNERHDYGDESEGSSGGPPTPQEKPLRTKRGHRRPSLPTLLPSPSPQQDPQRSSSGYILSPHARDQPMILEQRHNPQPATGPSLPRAYDPHSTFSIANGPILQPRNSSSSSNTQHHHHHHHHHTNNANANANNATANANGPATPVTQPPTRPTEPFRSFAAAATLARYDGINPDANELWSLSALEHAWHELGPAGQRPFEKVYEDQMREYQAEKDEYDRGRRRGAAGRGPNGREREGRVQGGRSGEERGRGDGEREREGEGRRGGEDVEMEMEMDGAAGTAGGFTAVNG